MVTVTGALILLALAGRWFQGGRGAQISVRKVLQGASWKIMVFSLGMYLVCMGCAMPGWRTMWPRPYTGLALMGGSLPPWVRAFWRRCSLR